MNYANWCNVNDNTSELNFSSNSISQVNFSYALDGHNLLKFDWIKFYLIDNLSSSFAKLRPNLTEALLRVWDSFILLFSNRPGRPDQTVKVFFLAIFHLIELKPIFGESLVKYEPLNPTG